jgi:hypothetical protein
MRAETGRVEGRPDASRDWARRGQTRCEQSGSASRADQMRAETGRVVGRPDASRDWAGRGQTRCEQRLGASRADQLLGASRADQMRAETGRVEGRRCSAVTAAVLAGSLATLVAASITSTSTAGSASATRAAAKEINAVSDAAGGGIERTGVSTPEKPALKMRVRDSMSERWKRTPGSYSIDKLKPAPSSMRQMRRRRHCVV